MLALIAASAISFVVAVLSTPILVAYLRSHSIGQPIHDDLAHHSLKAGTPTMGGIVVTVSLALAYPLALVVAHQSPTLLGLSAVLAVVAMGIVGAVDDWMKVSSERNLGLRELQKTGLQMLISLAFGLVLLSGHDSCHQLSLTRCSATLGHLPPFVFLLAVMALFWLTTNAVNFTDGIEGLLAGSSSVTFLTLAAIGYWMFRHPAIYRTGQPLTFAILAAALAAASCGLLWWNITPRTIFMGDTGSLALGAGLVVVCLCLGISLLLPIIGALYVGEGASSFLQRACYKLTKRAGRPRRLFKMAPIHHHFELKGWSEASIVIRFWIINAIAAGIAIAIFYGDALRQLPNGGR